MPDAFDVEYAERGEGPAILYLPGSFGTGSGWRGVVDGIGGGYRHITTSMLGYGKTPEPRRPSNTTMDLQVEALAETFARIGERCHVVAHSYGTICALAYAVEQPEPILSLTLIEPNPLDVLAKTGDHELYDDFITMRTAFFADVEAGVPDAARRVIDFYGGSGAFDAFPDKVRDYVIEKTRTNVLDWQSGTPFGPPLSRYEALAIPTLVIRGGNSRPSMQRISDILARRIPRAALHTIAGGSHFLPSTHAAEVARLASRHIERV